MDEVKKEQENFQKGNSKTKIIGIILVIAIIALGAAVAGYFLLNSPKKAFDKNMEAASKLIENKLFETMSGVKLAYDKNKTLGSDIRLYGEITTSEDSYYISEVKEISDIIKDVKLDIKNKLDVENENIYLYLGLDENGKTAISGEAFLTRDMLIGKLKDISENYLYAKVKDMGAEAESFVNTLFDSMFNSEYEDISKEYIDIIKKNITDKQYKAEDTVIKIDGNDTKVKKVSLTVTENEIKAILKDMINKLKTDDRILDIMVDSMNGTGIYTPEKMKEELIKNFDDLIKQIEDMDIKVNFVVNTYTKGSELVQVEIQLAVEIEGQRVEGSVTMNCVDKNNIKNLFKVKYGSIVYEFTLDIVKNGDKTTATLDLGSLIGIKAVCETTRISDSKGEIKISVTQSGRSILTITCNTEYYINTKEEFSAKNELAVDIMLSDFEEDNVNVKLVVETHLFYADGIQVPNIGNNDIDVINGEFPFDLLLKLQNKLNEVETIKNIMNMMSGGELTYTESSYDYNDDDYNLYNEASQSEYDALNEAIQMMESLKEYNL